jgi:hypothetical protein
MSMQEENMIRSAKRIKLRGKTMLVYLDGAKLEALLWKHF